MESIPVGKALNGCDLPLISLAHWCYTRQGSPAIHQDSAGTALTFLTTEVSAGKFQIFPENLKQGTLRIGDNDSLLTVNNQCNCGIHNQPPRNMDFPKSPFLPSSEDI
jgi:hypothetical protein